MDKNDIYGVKIYVMDEIQSSILCLGSAYDN